MGPWESLIVAVAALAAVVVAVLAFRGLIETVDGIVNTCDHCGKRSIWPLPVNAHACWRCRHGHVGLTPRGR